MDVLNFSISDPRFEARIDTFLCTHTEVGRFDINAWLPHRKIPARTVSAEPIRGYSVLFAKDARSLPGTSHIKKLGLFYGVFSLAAVALMMFAALELLSSLRSSSWLLPTPASVVLLIGSLGLLLEFHFGFKADLQARQVGGGET